MTAFLRGCLYAFAGCAVLGLMPASVLAARAGQPRLVAYILLAAALVMFVLVFAAVML